MGWRASSKRDVLVFVFFCLVFFACAGVVLFFFGCFGLRAGGAKGGQRAACTGGWRGEDELTDVGLRGLNLMSRIFKHF